MYASVDEVLNFRTPHRRLMKQHSQKTFGETSISDVRFVFFTKLAKLLQTQGLCDYLNFTIFITAFKLQHFFKTTLTHRKPHVEDLAKTFANMRDPNNRPKYLLGYITDMSRAKNQGLFLLCVCLCSWLLQTRAPKMEDSGWFWGVW